MTRSSTGTGEPQTKASWRVDDLATEVAELRSRGDPHGNSIGLLRFKDAGTS